MFQYLTQTLTHPVTLPVIGIVLAGLAVFAILIATSPDTKPRNVRFSNNPLMNVFGWFGVPLAVFGGFILIATGWELFALAIRFPGPDEPAPDIRWHSSLMLAMLAAIGAIFTLLFAYIRVFTTERQTKAAEDALFNDKINTAADDLHARRQVTQNPDEKDNRYDIWQDDVVKRNAAIDRLEGLVIESPDIAPRIARMLGVYVRELSNEIKPQVEPKNVTPGGLAELFSYLHPPRSDMQNAVQTLGRLQQIDGVDPNAVVIDLRRANLQRMDLSNSVLKNARLNGAAMQNLNLARARMQGADLRFATMQFANLTEAQLQGADLRDVEMNARTTLTGTLVSGAVVSKGILGSCDHSQVGWSQSQVNSMFYNETVEFADHIKRPTGQEYKLSPDEFETQWRAWRKANGFDHRQDQA